MKNWKTSLVGALAGILLTVGGHLEQQRRDPNASYSIESILQGAAVAVMGLLAKDHDAAA